MARIIAISFLSFTVLAFGLAHAGGEKDFQVKGTLTKNDPKDQQRGGPSQVHAVKLKAGKMYTIDMVSSDFDAYLRLLDNKDNVLAEDDDSGGGLNARIIFNCTRDGDYKVVCTSFGNAGLGNYALTVKMAGGTQQPATAHAMLTGKPAPDFRADFALHGAPIKLSDLKGKVVLLHFWEVRSDLCATFIPRLAEWNKLHKDSGLAVIGVTFYTSDIDQKIGFDKENGRITTVKEASHQSDQAVLRDFADYHKANYLLLSLAKKEALAAFDAYAVNSVPQLVLIDRKGMIRLIDASAAKNNPSLEAEIKKLLAEK